MDANGYGYSRDPPSHGDDFSDANVADGFYSNNVVETGPGDQPQVADSISPAMLTAATLTLQHRAFTAADELARQVEAPELKDGMAPLAEAVERLGQHVTDLHFTLEATRDIHTNAQSFMNQYLTSCDLAMGHLNKQLIRIGPPETLDDVNWEYVLGHTDLLQKYCDLFAYLEETLRLEDVPGQDVSIGAGRARQLMGELNEPAMVCAGSMSILLSGDHEPLITKEQAEAESFGEQSSKAAKVAEARAHELDEGEAPPPYEPAAESLAPAPPPSLPISPLDRDLPPTPLESVSDLQRDLPPAPSAPTRPSPTIPSGGSVRMSLPPPFDSIHPTPTRTTSDESQSSPSGSSSFTSFNQMTNSKAPAASAAPTREKQNSFTSITRSFRALTAGLRPKPDPLVSALCQAITNGDTQQITGLLKHGPNINGRNENGDTPLLCAINADQGEAADILTNAGADYLSSGVLKAPALFVAASAGALNVCKILISKGARVDQRSISGQPYFIDVVTSGNLAGIRFLLEHGANPNLSSINGRPVVAMAVKKNNIELLQLLIQHNVKLNVTDMSGNSLLAIALDKCDEEMFQLLLDNGADVNSRTVNGITVLTEAVTRGKIDLALDLISRGADPNCRDLMAQPVIIPAIKDTKSPHEQKVKLIKALLNAGASADAADNVWGTSCIWRAMETGSLELTDVLLQHGANMTTNKDDMTLLVYAIDKDEEGLADLLMKHGAGINSTDNKGRTPLAQAVVKHNHTFAETLLHKGAAPNVTTWREGTTLLIHAIEKMDLPLARLLLKNGADANLTDKKEKTPLLTALVKHDTQMLSLLVQYGADVARARRDAPPEMVRVFEKPDVQEALEGGVPGEIWPRMRGMSGGRKLQRPPPQ